MKLSNKILIGFFGFLLAYMLVAFTEIRLKGDLNRFDESSSLVEEQELPKVGHIIIPALDKDIRISSAEQPRIEVRSNEGEVLSLLKYEMQGDTLRLTSYDQPERKPSQIYIYVSGEDLRQIDIGDNWVYINDLNQRQLTIKQTGGSVRMQGNNNLQQLHVNISNSADLEGAGFDLETLSLTMDNARVRFFSSANHLEGSMSNESELFIKSANDIQFKKDEGSQWRMSY